MKVAFISNSIFDGAGIASYRIFKSVQNKGIETVFFTNDLIQGKEFKHLTVKKKRGLKNYFWNKFYWRKYQRPALHAIKDYDYFTVQKLAHHTSFQDLNYSPDIIHLHWINNILDYESFFRSIPNNIPIVWTLHDMSPFTGGCIYSWECEKFVSYCKSCPQLPLPGKFDLALYTQQMKHQLFQDKDLHLVADSAWLENQARKSIVFENAKSLRTIHYSIDSTVFKPVEKGICRDTWGFSSEDFVICFGATYLNSRRKGLTLLLQALDIVYAKYKKVKCLVYGSNLIVPDGFNPPPIISVGKIEAENLLKIIFSAADVFIIPSLQEAFGQTCLEAMCCGIPVVGFDVGGIPDMIIPGQTGLLAKPGDSIDLAGKILWMLENPDDRVRMGANARTFSVQNFSMEGQGNKYADLYRSIVTERPGINY